MRPTTTSGCKALDGCEKKETCLRYQLHKQQTGYRGWSAHQLCRISEFTEKKYLHYIEVNNESSH